MVEGKDVTEQYAKIEALITEPGGEYPALYGKRGTYPGCAYEIGCAKGNFTANEGIG